MKIHCTVYCVKTILTESDAVYAIKSPCRPPPARALAIAGFATEVALDLDRVLHRRCDLVADGSRAVFVPQKKEMMVSMIDR